MPVDLREIASIAGMPGLFRIVSPTRTGVIIETLAETPVRSTAQAKHRISLLHEISIYTNDPEVTIPLSEIFDNIRTQHGDEIPVHGKSSNAELTSFMESILPDYDRDRVYMSDIKKIANWYNIVKKFLNFDAAALEKESATAEEPTEKAEKKTKAKAETKTEEAEEKPAKKTKAKTETKDEADEKPKAEAKPKKTKKSAE
jgi:hypothetical protein